MSTPIVPFNREPWTAQAVCVQTDPEAFFPEKGQPSKAAKAVCDGCPVRIECRDYAIANRMMYGIWGGHSVRELQGMRRSA